MPASSATSAVLACTRERDRKSTRLNSSHVENSYAVFCLKKKSHDDIWTDQRVELVAQPAQLLGAEPQLVVGQGARLVFFFLRIGRPPRSTLFPYTALFR